MTPRIKSLILRAPTRGKGERLENELLVTGAARVFLHSPRNDFDSLQALKILALFL